MRVAERAEVEDRGGEPERVADSDEVEPGLAGVEGLADVRQGDVGDARLRLATAATAISAVSTSLACGGLDRLDGDAGTVAVASIDPTLSTGVHRLAG